VNFLLKYRAKYSKDKSGSTGGRANHLRSKHKDKLDSQPLDPKQRKLDFGGKLVVVTCFYYFVVVQTFTKSVFEMHFSFTYTQM